ncbi:MAG: LPS assembly lipoprotein LptE, partial [Arenimonas sp.]
DSRVGQILRNELLTLFATSGRTPAARYRLEIQLASSTSALAISSDDTITRYNVILEARVRLVALDSTSVVYRATTRSVGSYDVQRSDYGTRIAEQATREDAARDLGRRIATMVSAVLAQGAL